ncbi:McrBC 5-methylcytosine restriction system component [Actinomadura viridis]|uniref:5-methylcytosine-specific restriction enzyme subunit McrC n=1 Tax=Actinomadura viridis TaxID=58110 RepID=A0A931DBX0_9ACTN|nr:hypothetical protein [Actinomadura viridis]MBG6086049.1 5-methylcytosine-specific restriction enzyme subunit McrC [Actinomadura viridis]
MRPIEVDEHKRRIEPNLEPGPADLEATGSPDLAKRITLRWLRGNVLDIKAGSHIGVVNLDCVCIRVRPKLAGSELGVLQMLDYASGVESLRDIGLLQQLGEGLDLRDLVCLLLNQECDRLLQHGLRRDYLRREEALPVVRGRLLADRQVLHRFGRLDRLECRYDERSGDIDDNRLCAAALWLAARTARASAVREHARRLAAQFTAHCGTVGFDARATVERLTYHRANEHYRNAHRWAAMLIGHKAFGNLYTTSGITTPAFMIDMNGLFEDFVVRLLRDAVAGTDISVRRQDTLRSAITKADGRAYTRITPDLQLVRGHGPGTWRCSVDAKYKLYTDRRLSTADLYQSFAYAHALSSSSDTTPPTAYLLYAADHDRPPETVTLHRRDRAASARVTSMPINVRAILAALAAGDPPPLQIPFHALGR